MKIKMLRAGSPWRTVALVVAVVFADVMLCMVSIGLGIDDGTVPDPENSGLEWARFGLAPLFAPLGGLALIWRHRFPKSVAAATAIVGALSFSGFAFFVALFLLAKRRLDGWVAGAIVLAVGAEALLGIEPLTWGLLLFAVVGQCAIAAWGAYRGQRARALEVTMASLRDRAERADAERLAETNRSKLAERHRIAREMHDTLAHKMSLVAVQAAALQVDAPDTETANAAKVIRETAHAALGELRDVLGVLHEDGTSAVETEWTTVPPGLSPGFTSAGRASLDVGSAVAVKEPAHSRTVHSRMAPSDMGQIAGLVQEWRQAGIALDYSPNPELASAIPEAVSRAAYRVVQEGITNVCRHAPGAQAAVTLEMHSVESGSSELHILVVNDRPSANHQPLVNDHQFADDSGDPVQPAPGAGIGLVGLAERIRLLGGTLHHGPTKSGFELQAVIPAWHQNGGSPES
ncbi:sensor histidine kinase [Specibacter sp. AOP5-B1-6]|uniref:sensor histidine kinase n=1 Tax=Specibacter sp. AOP5-B1-6 TaxID=3457653 RepID=UPI00402BA0DB